MFSATVQTEDFDQQALYDTLRSSSSTGAIVTFTGLVRDFSVDTHGDHSIAAPLHLEHYPGMTEKVLTNIITEAQKRWALHSATIVHRVGSLPPSEQIVFVGVACAHRQAAFEACNYLIDILKTRAPFWKKEGHTWVEAKASDTEAAARWLSDTLKDK